MPYIPAICNDVTCRTIFPSDASINETGNPSTHINMAASCPTCGGAATVSINDYHKLIHLITDKIFSAADIQLLKQIQKKIDKTLKKNKPHRTVQELEKISASWLGIWSLIPDDKAEAYAFLRLIFSFVSSAITAQAETGKIAVKAVLINKSFNHYYQLVAPSLLTKGKRPQLKPLANAIRKAKD